MPRHAHAYALAQEADKLDAVASDEQREAVHNATEEPLPGKEGPSEWEEVVVAASADGTITAVNGAIQRLLGYRNGELLGRTIGTLMPHAVAALHPAYMRSSRLGVGEQSGPRNLLGLSKAGYGVPLSIIVTRTRRHDKMGFMAQIRPRSIEPPWPGTTLVLWMTHGGVIMAANEALCSTLGYPAWELQRKPALTIVDRAALDKIADLAAGAEGAEEDDMGESPQSLLLHVMLVPKKRSDELQAPLLRCDGVVVLEGQGRSSYIMLALKVSRVLDHALVRSKCVVTVLALVMPLLRVVAYAEKRPTRETLVAACVGGGGAPPHVPGDGPGHVGDRSAPRSAAATRECCAGRLPDPVNG